MKSTSKRTLWLVEQVKYRNLFTNEWRKFLPIQIQSHIYANNTDEWKLKIIKPGKTEKVIGKRDLTQLLKANMQLEQQTEAILKLIEFGRIKNGDRLFFLNQWHPGIFRSRQQAQKCNLQITIDVLWQSGEPISWNSGIAAKDGSKKRTDYKRKVFCTVDRNYFATEAQWRALAEELEFFASEETVHIVGWPIEYLGKLIQQAKRADQRDTILFPQNTQPYYQSRMREVLQPLFRSHSLVAADEKSISRENYLMLLNRSVAVIAAGRKDCLGIGVFEGLLAGAIPIVPRIHSFGEVYFDHCMPRAWTTSLIGVQRHKKELAQFIKNKIESETPESLAVLTKKVSETHFNGRKLYESLLR